MDEYISRVLFGGCCNTPFILRCISNRHPLSCCFHDTLFSRTHPTCSLFFYLSTLSFFAVCHMFHLTLSRHFFRSLASFLSVTHSTSLELLGPILHSPLVLPITTSSLSNFQSPSPVSPSPSVSLSSVLSIYLECTIAHHSLPIAPSTSLSLKQMKMGTPIMDPPIKCG